MTRNPIGKCTGLCEISTKERHKHRYRDSQLGALCCNLILGKYQKVESSHLVPDYKHTFKLKFPLSYHVQPLARLKNIEEQNCKNI